MRWDATVSFRTERDHVIFVSLPPPDMQFLGPERTAAAFYAGYPACDELALVASRLLSLCQLAGLQQQFVSSGSLAVGLRS